MDQMNRQRFRCISAQQADELAFSNGSRGLIQGQPGDSDAGDRRLDDRVCRVRFI